MGRQFRRRSAMRFRGRRGAKVHWYRNTVDLTQLTSATSNAADNVFSATSVLPTRAIPIDVSLVIKRVILRMVVAGIGAGVGAIVKWAMGLRMESNTIGSNTIAGVSRIQDTDSRTADWMALRTYTFVSGTVFTLFGEGGHGVLEYDIKTARKLDATSSLILETGIRRVPDAAPSAGDIVNQTVDISVLFSEGR